jgi:hypothetical protein
MSVACRRGMLTGPKVLHKDEVRILSTTHQFKASRQDKNLPPLGRVRVEARSYEMSVNAEDL